MANAVVCPPQPSQTFGRLGAFSASFPNPFRSTKTRRPSAGSPSSTSAPTAASCASAPPTQSLGRRVKPVASTAPTSPLSAEESWLDARRCEERDFVLAHDTSDTDIWYLVDVAWLTEWKRFVSQGEPPPGPLRPEALIDRRTGQPRPNLKPIHHYRGVNANVWSYWAQLYGGGPPIRRRKLDLYAPPMEEDSPVFLPAQVPTSSSCSSLARLEKSPSSPDKSQSRPASLLRFAKNSARRITGSARAAPAGRFEPTGFESDDVSKAESPDNDASASSVFFVKESYALVVRQPPDGSCLFHALSFGLDDGSEASSLRLAISNFIADNPELNIAGTALKEWVKFDSGGGVDAYAADIATGTWGGGLEMEVFVRLKGASVHVYEACAGGYRRICCFDVGASEKSSRTVNVLYRERGSCGMEHYDALLLGDKTGQWVPRSYVELGAPGGA
eukprot:TRINITY_DN12430_c0_g1_i1.p1 TRINITY_DN12430_c0_g1~~TRINITY_DN12430_c0_g1_i1.p1  ORF type:complete len:446 (+),score=58.30 TRINITY_DN12430_c0_g1_i1:139-1476(+)